MPDLYRRRLLMAMALSPLIPSFPSPAAQPDSDRVIALEWLPTELLLALGVNPLGVADVHNYNVWVGQPPLPAGVVDVGLRTEPNLELMTQMHPSLILCSNGYGPPKDKLRRIAPIMGFDLHNGDGKPLSRARASLRALAARLGREAQAEAHLQQVDAEIAAARQRLAPHAGRAILLMSLLDSRHAITFGKNSLFLEVMALLNLKNAWQGETNFWGSAVIGLERLAVFHDVEAICFDHDNDAVMQQLSRSPLWQSMPFVHSGHFQRVPAVWYYGATLSALHFIRVLERALEKS
ncbi:Fe(3+)-hydroxamate ABC transporter substrate-binding protein FhuD [Pantoea stewartii]|uniref:Fe(3+)-hydroxamate ABC transporter substrate-binding protein FhuD n=1 Tax=Pantoea stewartii TaxID=66269 RepID=UPI00050DC91D|nr:Fe(3+)-hydroxamate ABC transporter substrate-binding protein FhuD [Pantoea stewartii]KGD83350.1 iron-hydroxamate transporter substrate-binding subunit [Pantoea stewartii subsp. indologenes]MCU7368153.1 Fe(3+)-hydroxamate ABC transporter substrate-binding protein FhuD [Pantoea stewartii]QIE98587.1 Fe(3+)-hydroxamate ABC transporter substrate-binding protein FhuD [Pantoea stewartii]